MRIAKYALPLAALLPLAACGGETAEADGNGTTDAGAGAEAGSTENVAEAEPAPTTLDAIPAKFRGYWDSVETTDFACTDLSDGVVFIDAKEVSFYEAMFEPKTITEVSPDEISSDGVFNELGEESKETYRLKLSKGGKRLTLAGDGFDPFDYRKCGAKLKEADLNVIPADFHGKWAWQDPKNCPTKPFQDLIVEEKYVTLGGEKSKVEKLNNKGGGSIEIEYKTSAGKPAEMYLDLIENGRRIAFGEPGATGMLFARCP